MPLPSRPVPSRRIRVLIAGLAAVLLLSGLTAEPSAAGPSAAGVNHARSQRPGDVVSQRAFSAVGLDQTADITFVQYLSTTVDDAPVVVNALIFVPRAPWAGLGRRPVVGYAPGSQGLGDSCAASSKFADGSEYEEGAVAGLLAQGYVVAISDYEGLGTSGGHPYVNRVALGHNVLDAVRAAQRVGIDVVNAKNPVLIAGFSEGGTAAAGALELAATYAPELNVIGGYAGGVPADFNDLATSLQNGPYGFLLVYTTIGMDVAYPRLRLRSMLSPAGQQAYDQLSRSCIGGATMRDLFMPTDDLAPDGMTVDQLLAQPKVQRVLAEMKLGNHPPSPEVPVMVEGSRFDDIVGYDQVMAMAQDWCRGGASVQTYSGDAVSHIAAYAEQVPVMLSFLAERVAGLPFSSSC